MQELKQILEVKLNLLKFVVNMLLTNLNQHKYAEIYVYEYTGKQ